MAEMKLTLPQGASAVTPLLIVHGAHELIHFLERVLMGKRERLLEHTDGKVARATVSIDGARIEIAEVGKGETPRPGAVQLYVRDVDLVYEAALAAGAKTVRRPAETPLGERVASIEDPTGNHWHLALHREWITDEAWDPHAVPSDESDGDPSEGLDDRTEKGA